MDVNIILLVTNIFVFAICAVVFPVMPWITRDSYLFGVKIPQEEQHSPEATQLKRRYKIRCLVGMMIPLALCVVQFIAIRDWTILATMYLPILIVPVFLAAFIPCWKAATRLKAERGWQVSGVLYADTRSARVRGSLSALPWVWYMVGFAIIFVTVLIANFRYYDLPDMIPIRFDANMQPAVWTEKSFLTVLMMPLINLGLLIFMIPVAILIEKVKLQIDPAKPKLSFAQHRGYRRRMGHAIGFLTLVIIIFIALTGLLVLFPDSAVLASPVLFWGGIVAIHIPVVVLIAVFVKSGQGGCKIKVDVDDDESDDADESAHSITTHPGYGDDKHWRLGMFYYNPDDPAYFVEYRFGGSYSLNYAHLPAKIGAALLAVGLVALYVWVTIMAVGYWL